MSDKILSPTFFLSGGVRRGLGAESMRRVAGTFDARAGVTIYKAQYTVFEQVRCITILVECQPSKSCVS